MEGNTEATYLFVVRHRSKRVSSKGNVVDTLSRGVLGELAWYDEVKVPILVGLTSVVKQVFPPHSKTT